MQRSEEELLELMNAVADRQATPEQEAELFAALRSSPEARQTFAEVQDTVRKINEVPRVNPPADLKPAVMKHLQWRAAAPAAQPATRPPSAHRRLYFSLGWAAAAMLVLAVFLFSPIREWGTSATMAPIIGKYDADGVSLTVRRQGDTIWLEPRSSYLTKVSLAWDPEKLTSSEHKGQVTVTLGDPTVRRPQVVLEARTSGKAEVVVSRHGREVMRAVIPLQ
jgi:hypothetical protein